VRAVSQSPYKNLRSRPKRKHHKRSKPFGGGRQQDYVTQQRYYLDCAQKQGMPTKGKSLLEILVALEILGGHAFNSLFVHFAENRAFKEVAFERAGAAIEKYCGKE